MELTNIQLEQVDAQIKRLLNTDSYYGNIYRKKGLDGVTSQEDFEKLPFSSKDESILLQVLRENRLLFPIQPKMWMIGQ